MKKEDALKIADDCGVSCEFAGGTCAKMVSLEFSVDQFFDFVSAIEQATLERAAKVCDASAKAFAEGEQGEVGLRVSLWAGASKGAEVLAAQIRELKDSNG